MKQKLFIFLPLILLFILPQPILAAGANSTAAATPSAGVTTPTFILFILGGSLLLGGLLIQRRFSYKISQ